MKGAFITGTLAGTALVLAASVVKDEDGESYKDKALSEGQKFGQDLAGLGRAAANAYEAAGRLTAALPQASASIAELKKAFAQFSQKRQD